MKTFTKTVQGVTFQGRDYEVRSIKVQSAQSIFQMDHVGDCPDLRPAYGHMPYAVGPNSERPNHFWKLLPLAG